MIKRWLTGAVLFYGPWIGIVYGFLILPKPPWWAYTCAAYIAISYLWVFLTYLPGRIRNGYWGDTPSASPMDHIKAQMAREAQERNKSC